MSVPAAFVYIETHGVTRLAGRLYTTSGRGRTDASTFLYDDEWIAAPDRFALEPALTVSAAPHFTLPGRALFGALGDSAPDRWGQTLLRREERARARIEQRAPRTLREIDFLLGVTDSVRQGALRFAAVADGPFLAPEREFAVPPLVDLPRLLGASDRFLADEESAEDLRLLLAPGSSLGGARPKASVRDAGGELLIGKFPKPDDEYRLVAWEAIALELAAAAGINAATHRLQDVAGRDVLLLNRFDRVRRQGATHRVPYLSALSMLGTTDGVTHSYPEIADAIRQYGAAARTDLRELWRRMAFTVLISNTDDHMRNHGFLYDGPAGWRLSPAYDLNPVPEIERTQLPNTAITENHEEPSIAAALAAAPRFGLKTAAARIIVREVFSVVAGWRKTGRQLRIPARTLATYASAFEHPLMDEARRLL